MRARTLAYSLLLDRRGWFRPKGQNDNDTASYDQSALVWGSARGEVEKDMQQAPMADR